MMPTFTLFSICLIGLTIAASPASPIGDEAHLFRLNLVQPQVVGGNLDGVFGSQLATKWVKYEGPAEDEDEDIVHLRRMNMLRYRALSFIAELEIGTPSQKFRMLLDSGSAELWVPSANCKQVDHSIVNTFNASKSSSFESRKLPVQVGYINGVRVQGELGSDLVRFGDLSVGKQLLGVIDTIRGAQILQNFRVDGIMGLNFVSDAYGPGQEGPMSNIMRVIKEQSKGRAKSMISVSLDHGREPQKAGQLVIGGIDRKLYTGAISWAPMIESTRWEFRLDAILLSGSSSSQRLHQWTPTNVCRHGCEAIADTGAMLIVGPPMEVANLNERLGARYSGNLTYVFDAPCRSVLARLPQVAFVISGRKFSLTPEMYTRDQGDRCMTIFHQLDPGLTKWILGAAFIGRYYTILDFESKKIGFADSIYKAANSSLIDIS